MTAAEIIEMLQLRPLAPEGGHYRETCRYDEGLAAEALPADVMENCAAMLDAASDRLY